MYIIGDVGSCHGGEPEKAFEAIAVAKDAGLDAIKFQLFRGNENGNIELDRNIWFELVSFANEIGIEIFASVFDNDAVDLLWESGCRKVKIAYSQNFNLKLIKHIKKYDFEIIASGDTDNYPTYADVKLHCFPNYPRKDCCDKMNGALYLFDGFSSHYLGFKEDEKIIKQTKWKYLEKHFHLDHEVDCPDYWFGLSPTEVKECVKKIRELSQ